MPELPEVETVCRGIAPLVVQQGISAVISRVPRLRWDIPLDLDAQLVGQTVRSVERRAKYILLELDSGTLVIHLGMTGILRVVETSVSLKKHDHFDLVFEDGKCLRLNDSRRFGAVVFVADSIEKHPLFIALGPEPLSDDFNSAYLHNSSLNRKVPIKNFLMDQKVVVGVGNIYASEVLFRTGVDPRTPANRVSRNKLETIVNEIKLVLQEAIAQGGTTIRDFEGSDGKPGYFKQQLQVYGRDEQPCVQCHQPVRKIKQGGRSTFFCPECQR